MPDLTKITNSTPPEWTGVEYSSVCPFNADNTRLLLIKRDHFGLYDGDGKFLKDLPISSSAEPRWSRTDPQTFYFVSEATLKQWTDGVVSNVHAFNEYMYISGRGESDISADGDHLVLCGARPDGIDEVFVYEISTGKKQSIWPQSDPFDGLKIDSRNRIVLSKDSGVYVFDGTVSWPITSVNGHACLARLAGRDVLLWCAASDPKINANAVVAIDIKTRSATILHTFDWDYSFHITAPDNEPWCIVSTDCPKRTLPSQLWKVYYDKTKAAEFVADTGSIYVDYNSQVKAAISRDGSRIVGCSNFGNSADLNYCDVFMRKLQAPQPVYGTRMDYSAYVGKSVLVMVPRADGAVDIFEKKL